MKPVGSKWYNLGIDLLEKDDVEALNTIGSQYPTDLNTCCTKMFQLWLSKQPTASWNQLIDSLRQPSVDLPLLATNIEEMLLQPKQEGTIHYVCISELMIMASHQTFSGQLWHLTGQIKFDQIILLMEKSINSQ